MPQQHPQRRILLADDEYYLTHILSGTLGRVGHAVVVADDGEAAFRLACEQRPDLVISDLQMPLLDGLGLGTRLRGNPLTANIPMLLLTGRGHLVNPADLARTNIRCLLTKPFSTRELLRQVDALLSGRAAAAAAERKAG